MLTLMAAGIGLAGCAEQPEIVSYKVQRVASTSVAASASAEQSGPSRMLGAIVIAGDEGWFFKLQGPDAAVAKLATPFRDLMKSVKLPGTPGGDLTWTTPAGWKQEGASGMRFATLIAPSEEAEGPIELSISKLPYQTPSEDEYLLANFNRWRGQLSLDPITVADLPTSTERIKCDGGVAIVIEIAGTTSASNAMGGPFSGGGPFAGGGATPPIGPAGPSLPPVGPVASGDSDLTYDLPKGWSEQPLTSLRKASLSVGIGDKQAEITVIPLGGQAGDWVSNVNRWRGQVGLPPMSEEDLAKEQKSIEVGGVTGKYVEAIGTDSGKTILGVMAVRDDVSWFIKLTGPSSIAAEEKERFEQFTRSLKWK